MSEYHMLVIQKRRPIRSNIKLRAISILLPQISHADHILLVMLVPEGLILECWTIYRLPTCAVTIDYITAMDTEARDDSVERTSFKVKRLSLLAWTIVAGAQG